MADAVVAGLVFGMLVAVLVGTASMALMETPTRRGLGVALAAGGGVACADGLWAIVAAAAGAVLRRLFLPWDIELRWAAVGVLALSLAMVIRKIVRGDLTHDFGASSSPRRAYREFFGHAVRNAGTAVLFGSLILGTAPNYGAREAAGFAAGVFLASLGWQWLLVVMGSLRREPFSDRTRRRVLVLDCALLILLIVYIGLGLYVD